MSRLTIELDSANYETLTFSKPSVTTMRDLWWSSVVVITNENTRTHGEEIMEVETNVAILPQYLWCDKGIRQGTSCKARF